MFKRLEEIIKSLKGNVLIIELDDLLIDKFNTNNKVNLYSISSGKDNGKIVNTKKKFFNRGKTINIKRIRKYINKKSIDTIICNMDEIYKYYKYFIKDSIYLNDNLIYIYSSKETDIDFIIQKYKRYNVVITKNEYKNGYIVCIDSSKAKNKFFKDKIYFIKDTFYNIAEFIGNILIS